MKVLYWLLGLLVGLVGLVYIAAFTSLGNGIVKPYIQEQIVANTKLESTLKTFALSMSDFEILLELNDTNTILVKGNYSLFSQNFNLVYRLNLEKLESLTSLTQTQLNGSLFTEGKVVGDMKFIKVDGNSNVASSKTSYHIELTDFNPTSILATIEGADLHQLLHILNQKSYASADINLDVNFKNITPHALDGNIKLTTLDGMLNTKVMKNDFNITIPQTAFAMNLDATLKGDDVDYSYELNSNLAKISSSGKVVPQPFATDINYALDIKELAVLKPMTGADLRGKVNLNGSLKGNREKLLLKLKSDIASSNTSVNVYLKEFKPDSLKAKIKGLKLQKVLYMVKQPHYADGLFDLDVDISDANIKSLKGTVTSTISKGHLDAKFMTKEYKFKTPMSRTTFHAKSVSKLNGDIVDTKLDFRSNLANVAIEKAKFKISDASLNSDYKVKVHNLNELYFATDRHLKGNLVANGEIHKAEDLDFIIYSDVAGGKLTAKLHNDDFTAKIDSMKSLSVLDMLLYPKVFDSSINGDVKYNLATSKGNFKGKLYDGKFTKNQVLDLTKKYAHIDMYKQLFKGDVRANINRENIVASVDLKSNTSSIITKNTRLNSKTNRINSKIDVSANGNRVDFYLNGDINAPKIKVSADELIQKEATKAIKKGLNKYFKGLF